MIQPGPLPSLGGIRQSLRTLAVTAVILLSALAVWSAQNPAVPQNGETLPPASAIKDQAALTVPKTHEEAKKTSAEKTQIDVAELSALAEQLRDELNKMDVHVLSLGVLHKTEAIEKLAKKIKGEVNDR